MRMDIFFNIAKFKLLASEQQKIGEVAAYMKKYPQTKVVITGLADKGTGTDKINIPLSKKRAEIVKDMLVKQHGIDASIRLNQYKNYVCRKPNTNLVGYKCKT